MIHTGKHDEYWWLAWEYAIPSLADLVVRFHLGLRACVTSFDSGPLILSQDEVANGWSTHGGLTISPPLKVGFSIPHDQYDEWLLVNHADFEKAEIEVFVNYGGFTLVPPDEISDPTYDKNMLQWLPPLQERFWLQMKRVRPESYAALGDNDIVASRNERFIQGVREADEADAAS